MTQGFVDPQSAVAAVARDAAAEERANRAANLAKAARQPVDAGSIDQSLDQSVPPDRLFVRPYQTTDLDAVIEIFLRAIREVAVKDYDRAQVDAWAQVDRGVWARRRLSRPTWVAVIDQERVGFTDLEPDGHLDMMFVHPAHQAIGVATLLLATVEAAATARGINRLSTEASLTARPFFERRGFSVLASQRVEKRGQFLTNFRMEKTLT